MDTLTPEQTAQVDEFLIITGTDAQDPDTSTKVAALLSHHGFNLNNAVLAFFDTGLEVPEPPQEIPQDSPFDDIAATSGAERFESTVIHRNLQDEFSMDHFLPKLPKAPHISNKWQFDLGIHMSRRAASLLEKTPLPTSETDRPKRSSFLWIILLIIPKAFSFLFSLLRFITNFASSPVYRPVNRLFNYDDYEEGYDYFTDLKRIENSPNFNISTVDFNKSHELSQREYDFLLMILVDNDTENFVQELLMLEQFSTLFDKTVGTFKDTRIYISNIDKSPEAFEVAKTYKARRFPYVSLIGNVSNNPAVMSSMSITYKSNLYLGDSEEDSAQVISRMLKNVTKCLTSYSPQLVTKKYDKQEIEMSRLIKEQQDEAYLESLQQDKVKKQEKERKLQEQITSENLRSLKNSYLLYLASSDWFQKQVEGASPSELVRVSVKLPNGKRVIQKFLKSATLNEVHLFVELQLFDGVSEVEQTEIDLQDYFDKIGFMFELFKPLPKVTLPSSMQTIEEFGQLKSGDSILVEYLDDER